MKKDWNKFFDLACMNRGKIVLILFLPLYLVLIGLFFIVPRDVGITTSVIWFLVGFIYTPVYWFIALLGLVMCW
jgi:hypothetical protein